MTTTGKNKSAAGKAEPVKIQVTRTAKAAREKRIQKLKALEPTKVDIAATHELLVKTNERLEEIYDLIKGNV